MKAKVSWIFVIGMFASWKMETILIPKGLMAFFLLEASFTFRSLKVLLSAGLVGDQLLILCNILKLNCYL